ncbi:MAG: hypothetical protein O3A51_05940, partial [Verrucomicrobia bacterium]|nr:hypothetical protein [Verrucomicrobiota bacterium]
MPYLIPKDLCTRCGACYAEDRIGVLRKDADEFPLIVKDDPAELSRLRTICTGCNWAYRELLAHVHGHNAPYDPTSPDIGSYLSVGIAYSTSTQAVELGQSGGASTTLMRAGLELGVFDACLGVRRPSRGEGNPFTAQPVIVEKAEDVLVTAGSKYTLCPSLELLPELARHGRRFCLSLLPCQTVAFYQLAR